MEIQWSLVLFTALSGMGAWMFVCVGIDEFRGKATKVSFPASILAVVLLAIGGICSVMHLSHPERMLAALNHPTSGIFMEALLLGLTAFVAIIYAILLKRNISATVRKVFSALGIVLAAVLSYECGASYMMSSQLSWNTVTLPLCYMGTAAASGTALYLLLLVVLKAPKEALPFAGTVTAAGGMLALVLAAAYGFVGGAALGDYAPIFWVAGIVCGGLIPIVFGLLAKKKTESSTVLPCAVIALAGALVGAIAIRCLMWLTSEALMSFFDVVI